MKLIEYVGNAAGILGSVACLVAGLSRLGRIWSLGAIEIPALFQLGIGLMVFACLAKLHVLVENEKAGK